MQAIPDSKLPSRGIGHHHGDHQCANPLGASLLECVIAIQQRSHATNPRADDNPGVMVVAIVAKGEPGVGDGPWATPYFRWLTDAEEGLKIEPPADHPIREILGLWDQCRTEPDETKRNALFKQLLDIHKEHPFMIGTVGEAPKPYIVNNNFFNVPNGAIDDDTLRNIGHTNPQQYFTRG